MRVYLVIEEWAKDFDNGVNTTVFTDLEKAKTFLKSKIEVVKTESCYSVEEIKEYSYCGYDEGEYAENHTNVYLEIKEIN